MKMRTLLPLAFLSVFAACAPATRLIVLPSTTAATPSKDSATLLIGQVMNMKVVNLFDQNGEVIGQLSARQHTVLQVPPGAIKIYAVPEKKAEWGDRVEGTVEAGKVYYLSIGMRWGGISMSTIAQRVDAQGWKERKTYETDLSNVKLDSAQLAGLKEDLGDTKPLLATVDGVVATFDAEEKKARTVEPGDGE